MSGKLGVIRGDWVSGLENICETEGRRVALLLSFERSCIDGPGVDAGSVANSASGCSRVCGPEFSMLRAPCAASAAPEAPLLGILELGWTARMSSSSRSDRLSSDGESVCRGVWPYS